MLKEMFAQFVTLGAKRTKGYLLFNGSMYEYSLVGTDIFMQMHTNSPFLYSCEELSLLIDREMITIESIKFVRRSAYGTESL